MYNFFDERSVKDCYRILTQFCEKKWQSIHLPPYICITIACQFISLYLASFFFGKLLCKG
jgi:hypothetical protein